MLIAVVVWMNQRQCRSSITFARRSEFFASNSGRRERLQDDPALSIRAKAKRGSFLAEVAPSATPDTVAEMC